MPYAVCDLDWHKDLAVIRRFYARFTETPINPDEFDQTIGAPLAILDENEIISFAIPLSFREGKTEIGAVATIPEQRNKGFCKSLISVRVGNKRPTRVGSGGPIRVGNKGPAIVGFKGPIEN